MCVSKYGFVYMSAVPMEDRRGCWTHWSCSCGNYELLGTKL